MIEIDPPSHPLDSLSPFAGVAHDDGPAFCIVRGDSHFHDIFFACDAELLVDFVFDGEAVRVPAKTPFDRIPIAMGKTGHRVLLRVRGIALTNKVGEGLP